MSYGFRGGGGSGLSGVGRVGRLGERRRARRANAGHHCRGPGQGRCPGGGPEGGGAGAGAAIAEVRDQDGVWRAGTGVADQAPEIRPCDLARLLVILHEGATAMRLTEEARGELAEFPEDLLHRVVDGLFHPAAR
ncbi:hypothetical protein [Kitasatospora sp. NPDC017646]|uniref:hypothetical protein n=1 Tax=Kitasatospora sp. NPDC017646 TaxID=3364024 RepID=UPI00378D63AF